MPVVLGAIADDFTGATDLCNTLVRRGMKTVQLIDVPFAGSPAPDAEAVVIALKSRTVPVADAVTMSLKALDWLKGAPRAADFVQILLDFRLDRWRQYRPCRRSILLDALGANFTLYCPAFPEAGRTIFKGYLFVGDELLSESGMKDHPLTPMRDPSLVRVLQRPVEGQGSGWCNTRRSRKARRQSPRPSPSSRKAVTGTRSSTRSPTATAKRSVRRPAISR